MSVFRNLKCFKEDPVEMHDRKIREAKANEVLSVDKRLDSRADADRVARGIAAPAKPSKGKRLTAPIEKWSRQKTDAGGNLLRMLLHSQCNRVVQVVMPQMPYGMPQAPMPG